jgi:hypothetical protein
MMRKHLKLISWTAGAIAALLLVNASLYTERTWEGRYTADPELRDFRCCGGPGAWWADGWWVEGPAVGELSRRQEALGLAPYSPASARLRGRISRRGVKGPLGLHKRVLVVDGVIDVQDAAKARPFRFWRKLQCLAAYLLPL